MMRNKIVQILEHVISVFDACIYESPECWQRGGLSRGRTQNIERDKRKVRTNSISIISHHTLCLEKIIHLKVHDAKSFIIYIFEAITNRDAYITQK